MSIGLSPLHLLLILVIAAIWVIPIVVVVLIVRMIVRRNRPDPRAILEERLARGEIGIEEFNAAMRALSGADARAWGVGADASPDVPPADRPGVPRDPPAPHG